MPFAQSSCTALQSDSSKEQLCQTAYHLNVNTPENLEAPYLRSCSTRPLTSPAARLKTARDWKSIETTKGFSVRNDEGKCCSITRAKSQSCRCAGLASENARKLCKVTHPEDAAQCRYRGRDYWHILYTHAKCNVVLVQWSVSWCSWCLFWVFSVYLQNEWLHSLHKEDQGRMY